MLTDDSEQRPKPANGGLVNLIKPKLALEGLERQRVRRLAKRASAINQEAKRDAAKRNGDADGDNDGFVLDRIARR